MNEIEEPAAPSAQNGGRPAQRIGFDAWWTIFVLWLLYVNSFLDRLILVMLVSPIKADLGLSDVQIGLILGPAYAIFYGLFGVPLGWAADRFPRRWVVYLGVSFWSLAASASGLARSFAALLLCRIGVGIGEASLVPTAYSLIGDKFPPRRVTTAMALFQTGSLVGAASAFAVGGIVIGFATSLGNIQIPLLGFLQPWQLTLIITGAPSIALALLVFTFSEPERRQAAGVKSREDDGFFQFAYERRAILLPMAIGFSLTVLLANSLVAWAPTYVTREFGWTPERYGPLLGLISFLSATTTVAKGWIVDWMYSLGIKDAHLRFYSWLLLVACPTAFLAFFVNSPILFLIMYGVVQTLLLNFMVFVASTVNLFTPSKFRGRIIAAFVSIFTFLGIGLGPLVTAIITDNVFQDEAKLGQSLALLSGITLPLAWIILRRAQRAVRKIMSEAPG